MSVPEFSILTYNMHKGFSGDGRRAFVLERMREAIAHTDVDPTAPDTWEAARSRQAETKPSF